MLTEEQRLNRRSGLGGSDSPIIMGYSTYKTPYQLYLEKTGIVSDEDEQTEQQYWGNALESAILRRFEEENKCHISTPDTIYHPEYPYLFANLDGWISDSQSVVEAKCVNSFQRGQWDMASADGIPLAYLIQIAKQCAITDATRGYCAVLVGGNEYMQFTYERDRALEDMIIQSDIAFWEKVQKRIEPDPINTSDCRLKYPDPKEGKTVDATFKVSHTLAELANLKLDLKKLNEKEDILKMAVMQYMGNAEYLIGQKDEVLATWKANKKGTRVLQLKGISI